MPHLERRVDDRHFVGFGPHLAGSDKGVCGVHRRFDVVGDLNRMGTANASVRRRTAGSWTEDPSIQNLTEDFTREQPHFDQSVLHIFFGHFDYLLFREAPNARLPS